MLKSYPSETQSMFLHLIKTDLGDYCLRTVNVTYPDASKTIPKYFFQ